MSKETMEQIRAAETEANRLIADAEACAEQMKADAVAAGRERLDAAEKELLKKTETALKNARKDAEKSTAKEYETAGRDADEIAEAAERRKAEAIAVVIGGLEAKCR